MNALKVECLIMIHYIVIKILILHYFLGFTASPAEVVLARLIYILGSLFLRPTLRGSVASLDLTQIAMIIRDFIFRFFRVTYVYLYPN